MSDDENNETDDNNGNNIERNKNKKNINYVGDFALGVMPPRNEKNLASSTSMAEQELEYDKSPHRGDHSSPSGNTGRKVSKRATEDMADNISESADFSMSNPLHSSVGASKRQLHSTKQQPANGKHLGDSTTESSIAFLDPPNATHKHDSAARLLLFRSVRFVLLGLPGYVRAVCVHCAAAELWIYVHHLR